MVAYYQWDAYAGAQLNAVIDEIKARGEPLAFKDFATEPVPYEENAVVLYRQAGDLLPWKSALALPSLFARAAACN